jgi:hypothetical protein
MFKYLKIVNITRDTMSNTRTKIALALLLAAPVALRAQQTQQENVTTRQAGSDEKKREDSTKSNFAFSVDVFLTKPGTYEAEYRDDVYKTNVSCTVSKDEKLKIVCTEKPLLSGVGKDSYATYTVEDGRLTESVSYGQDCCGTYILDVRRYLPCFGNLPSGESIELQRSKLKKGVIETDECSNGLFYEMDSKKVSKREAAIIKPENLKK